MTPRYDSILMLSGGKDSTHLAYVLSEQGKRTLGVTVDVGFMSQTAKDNIERVKDDLRMDHLWVKSQPLLHQQVIEDFRADAKQGLTEVCGKCTLLTARAVFQVAASLGVKHVIAGFTRYSAFTTTTKRKVELPGGLIYDNPHFEAYSLPHIERFLAERGFVTDPALTNCKHIREIIMTHVKRFGENPYEAEFNGLLRDGQITAEELERLRKWCTPNQKEEV